MNSQPSIVAIGELLWDLFPAGPLLGGAPANFACHAQALGARAALISRVGHDSLGERALESLAAHGLELSCVSMDNLHPTGSVTVQVDADGQPHFEIVEDVAWDYLESTPTAFQAVSGVDAICFGSLGQRNASAGATIQALVAGAPPQALRVFDINLRPPFFTPEIIESSLKLANVLKLNETELPVLAAQFALRGSPETQLCTLAERFNLKAIALTLGAAGSWVLRDGVLCKEPGRKVIVADAVGAGDAYTAALVMGLLREWPTQALMSMATEVAAFVCSKPGATPPLPVEFGAKFSAVRSGS